jgi:hypothetical protein
MKDVTISMFEYHVVASVPDLQTKPADSLHQIQALYGTYVQVPIHQASSDQVSREAIC